MTMAFRYGKTFWVATAERAISTGAQAALLTIGAERINAITASWEDVAGFALGGVVLSVLKSLIASKTGSNDGPSFVSAEKLANGRHAA